jgi:hypothetical protein
LVYRPFVVLPVWCVAAPMCRRACVSPRWLSNAAPTVDRRSVGPGGGRRPACVGSGPASERFKTDFTPPAAATISRARAGLGRWEIRGSRRGGVVLYVCGFGAVRR